MTATGFCQLTMGKERYGTYSRLRILTGNCLYLDGEAHAGSFWTGINSNDRDPDHLTSQDQHNIGHLGVYVLVPWLPGLCTCVLSGQLLQ